MSDINQVIMHAAICQPPELVKAGSIEIFKVNLCWEETVGSRTLTQYESVDFVGGSAAEYNAQFVDGMAVTVLGALQRQEWTDKQGLKQSRLSVTGRGLYAATGEMGLTPKGGAVLKNGYSKVIVSGKITRDAELRYIPSGAAVLKVGGNVRDSWKKASGEWDSRNNFVDLELWEDVAEKYQGLQKGERFYLEGRLRRKPGTDKEGVKKTYTTLDPSVLIAFTRVGEEGAPQQKIPAAKVAAHEEDYQDELPY